LKPLVKEALKINGELPGVIFIGAIARYFHTGNLRESQDLDFAVIKPLSEEFLLSKKYNKFTENKKEVWRTPRGIKIDAYTKDVSGIPINLIIKTATKFKIGKDVVTVIGLEALIVAKSRAQRDADIDDLRILARLKSKEIRWDVLKTITKDDTEYQTVKMTMDFLAKQ